MARRPSLKPKLNQIRTWVGEGVTDIWIAHQLESTPVEVADFRRKHGLLRPDESPAPATRSRRAPAKAAPKPAAKPAAKAAAEPAAAAAADDDDASGADGAEPAKRRRRGRRGGRGRSRARTGIPAVLEHGDDGLVIRIEASALEDAAYREHWAGVAAGAVAFSATGIAISAASAEAEAESDADAADGADDN